MKLKFAKRPEDEILRQQLQLLAENGQGYNEVEHTEALCRIYTALQDVATGRVKRFTLACLCLLTLVVAYLLVCVAVHIQ